MRGSKFNDLHQFFPLTPTLSLGEREFFSNLLTAWSLNKGGAKLCGLLFFVVKYHQL